MFTLMWPHLLKSFFLSWSLYSNPGPCPDPWEWSPGPGPWHPSPGPGPDPWWKVLVNITDNKFVNADDITVIHLSVRYACKAFDSTEQHMTEVQGFHTTLETSAMEKVRKGRNFAGVWGKMPCIVRVVQLYFKWEKNRSKKKQKNRHAYVYTINVVTLVMERSRGMAGGADKNHLKLQLSCLRWSSNIAQHSQAEIVEFRLWNWVETLNFCQCPWQYEILQQ